MALNTNTYGYVIDPLFSFCDQGGKTIANGYVRVFRAGTSTPVLTYRNFDGAFNAETIELDNSGRTMTKVIASKGDLYKVCVYDAEHSQEDPVLTVDKVAVIGASVNATNIVQGMNDVAGSGWIKSVSADDTANVSLDATNVTSEVDTMVKATAASADYMMPLVHKTGSDPDKKITLGNIFKFVLNFIHSLTDTATESDIASGNYFALDGSAGTKKLNSTTLLTKTAQNALAGNVAPAFVPNETNAVAGALYVYGGELYIAKVDYTGVWDGSKFDKQNVENLIAYYESWLDEIKSTYDTGKNLFNKNTINKKTGVYVNYSTGGMSSLSNYNAYVVVIGEGETIALRDSNVHIAAYNRVVNLPLLGIGKIGGYISGYVTTPQSKTWTTPLGCRCIIVSPTDSQLSTFQVERGSTPTSFESFKTGLDYNKLLNAPDFGGQITALEKELKDDITNAQTEVDTFYLKGDTGKNLFNKNTKNKAVGKYVDYANGKLMSNASWDCFVVPVTAGQHLSFRGTTPAQIHVAVFSKLPTLAEYNAGEVIDGFINSGFANTYNQNWEVPVSAVCIVLSCPSGRASSIQVEIGSSSTSYEDFKFGLDVGEILGLSSYLNNKFLYVGTGMTYTTIQSAVDAAEDGDTIVVFPGVYNESVDVHNSGKMLSIIGTCRDKCILTYSSGDYYKAPLEIGQGYVANLTIKATGSTLDEGATMFAYCVHIDYSEEANSALQFVNCVFENDARDCVGIGLRENFTLSFKSCSFTNYNLNNLEQARVFYCHEGPGSNHTNQKCELIDCTLFSASTARAFAVVLQEESANTGNDATFLIQRSICKTNGSWWTSPILMWDFTTREPASGGEKWKGSNCWNLDVRSALNNESSFNA